MVIDRNQRRVISIRKPSLLSHVEAFPYYQINKTCRDFDLRYEKCCDAYGYHKSQIKCSGYWNDLMECLYGFKQRRRLQLIMKEQEKQEKDGEKVDYLPTIRTDYVGRKSKQT